MGRSLTPALRPTPASPSRRHGCTSFSSRPIRRTTTRLSNFGSRANSTTPIYTTSRLLRPLPRRSSRPCSRLPMHQKKGSRSVASRPTWPRWLKSVLSNNLFLEFYSHLCHARSHRAGSGDRGRLARRVQPPSLDRTMRSLSQAPRLGRRPRASRGLFRGSFFTMDWPPSIATPQGLTDVLIKPVASSAHAADAPRGAHASDAHALQRGTAPLPAWASHVHHDGLNEVV